MPTIPTAVGNDLSPVIAGHSASEDARKRAYDPAIHPFRKDFLARQMDARVKPAHDESRATRPGPTRLPLGRDKAKVTARIPFGREVVTFSCGYWVGGVLPAGALNGGTDYDLSQDA
jgi:hypothetical protein